MSGNNSPVPKETPHRLLVVEDDEDLGELIRVYLKTRGFQVETSLDAMGPLSRLRKLGAENPPWDVILTDMRMPGVDGLHFIGEVQKLAPLLPVVLMTAHGGVEMAVTAVKEGAYDFVVKPLKFPELVVTLNRALSHRQLQEENLTLRAVLKEHKGVAGIIAKSPAMKVVCDLAQRVSNSMATVLIQGESGSGKEVIARAIHDLGNRKDEAFVAINCAAIPENLLESELFGFAKGAFTGAVDKKAGLFEEANGGTLFLDEIGDLGGALQAKLLRVLQERQIKRIGENQARAIDVRIIAATHRSLVLEVQEGRFREDLFFRLNVIPIQVPPLRERHEDILPLAQHFLKKFLLSNDSQVKGFSKAALEALSKMPWRGNVRELENTIERAVVLCDSAEIQPKDLLTFSQVSPEVAVEQKTPTAAAYHENSFVGVTEGVADDALPTLESLELDYIQWVLKRVGGVRERARRILDIDRKTLAKKVQNGAKVQSLESSSATTLSN